MKILLVRLRQIGDVVFTTPLLRALRQRFPAAHLTYVVESPAAPIVAGNPHLNQVFVVPKRGGLRRYADDAAAVRRLRREAYDIAIDLHGGPRGSLLTWGSGARMRVGYDMPGRSWMYTHTVHRDRTLAPRHSVLNQWDLLVPLGIPLGEPSIDPVEMVEEPAVARVVEQRLRDKGVEVGHPLVVLHVSANNAFRRWPSESFEALAVALVREDPSRRVLVWAGPSEPETPARIVAGARRVLGELGHAIVDLGDVDLPQIRALVARAAVYIGGDTGPLHVASTTTVPIVEIIGPTLAERSRPWRDPRWPTEIVESGPLPCRPCDQRVCAPGDFRCLRRIGPEQVFEAVRRVLRPTASAAVSNGV